MLHLDVTLRRVPPYTGLILTTTIRHADRHEATTTCGVEPDLAQMLVESVVDFSVARQTLRRAPTGHGYHRF